MYNYALIIELKALHIKQDKLFEVIQLHDQLKDSKIKDWEKDELKNTQQQYTQLKNKIYNDKD